MEAYHLALAWVFRPAPASPARQLHRLARAVANEAVPEGDVWRVGLWCRGQFVGTLDAWRPSIKGARPPSRLRRIGARVQAFARPSDRPDLPWTPQDPCASLPPLPADWLDKMEPAPVAQHLAHVMAPAARPAARAWAKQVGLEPPAQVPPWMHAALAGEWSWLRAELSQVRWDRADLARWWVALEALGCLSCHWDLSPCLFDPAQPPAAPRLLGVCAARAAVVHELCNALPAGLRAGQAPRLARFADLAPAAAWNWIDDTLRQWVSPSRFWALRGHLGWHALSVAAAPQSVEDWAVLPRAQAWRALDALATAPMPSALPALPGLPRLHARHPQWPGWGGLFARPEVASRLPPESRSFAAHLRTAALDKSLPQAHGSAAPLRVRF